MAKEEFWVLPLPKWDRSEQVLSDFSALARKQTLDDLDATGKRVLIRVDYNVPLEDGKVTDTARVDATLDTLRHLLDKSRGRPKCLVLICHLGRPGGDFDPKAFSLAPVADILRERIGDLAPVEFVGECVGPAVERRINSCEKTTVFLLENLRFHIEETGKGITGDGKKIKADPEAEFRFREALTRLGDVFVFEAFGAAHRPHSSVVGVDLPQRVAGLLMKRELDFFAKALGEPKRPLLGIIGGAKVSDKIGVIDNLLGLVDELIIGGGMAYTFKKVADGVEIADSLFDEEGAKSVERIMAKAKERGVKVHLPFDHVAASRFANDAETRVVADADGVPAGWMGLDCGPESRERNSEVIARAETVIWNGPLGVFEMPSFSGGTERAMHDLVRATARGATTIIGGGDTGAASAKFEFEGRPVSEQVSHVSTGGGSTLVLLEGTMLPGVDKLSNKEDLPPDEIDVRQLWTEVRHLREEIADLRRAAASPKPKGK